MKNKRLLASAVLAAVAVISGGALAQNRVDNGNARDANNRVGSGGFNSPPPAGTSPYVSGNNIVTGNVTGGREFRGFVPYTDPGAFRGQTAGTNVDNFVRQSAGVPVGIYGNNNAQNVMPFYGDSRGVAPPPGFVQQAPGQTAYVPATPDLRTVGDLRLGNPFKTIEVTQPRPGQLVLPGPVDASQQPTVITASPLYGVRQWKFGDQADQQFLEEYTDVYNGRRTNRLDDQTLERMRNEIGQQVEPAPDQMNDPNAPLDPNAGQSGVGTPLNSNMNSPLGQPGDTTNSGTLNNNNTNPNADPSMLQNQPLNGGLSNQPLANDIRRTEGMRNRLLTMNPTAAATSPQYRAMQDRLKRRQGGGSQLAEVEANREFRAQQMVADEAAKGDAGAAGGPNANKQDAMNKDGPARPGADATNAPRPGGVATPGTPGGPTMPGGTASPTDTTAAPGSAQQVLPGVTPANPQPGAGVTPPAGEKPIMIKSLTADMKDSAVVNLMTDAEKLMRDGKYTTALDKYDMVEQVVPNDPLVLLGRATAELGASYYTRADGHLREAFTRNPALLMGQYDLHTFLGDERLAFLVKDLKDLAQRNKNDPRPVFLLSYIAYNTGNERNAAAYLDLAEKRSNGKDPFFGTLRKHWTLPEAAPEVGAEMNK